jgi:hypothetical protein
MMREKSFRISPILLPEEVAFVHSIRIIDPVFVGIENYEKIKSIIKKYPEHFPWETKYNSLPATVHEEYKRKLGELVGEYYPFGETSEQYVEFPDEFNSPMTRDEVTDSFRQLVRMQERDYEFECAELKLWNSHYSKYKLYYRKAWI